MLETSDRPLLDLIRRRGPLSVNDIELELKVTGTAIRHRLTRLSNDGLIERRAEVNGRGRPRYTYQASSSAQRQLGQNYADLAIILWKELMHSVPDPRLRRILFKSVSERLAELYRPQIKNDVLENRMRELESILLGQGVEVEVMTRTPHDALPVLRQHSCPYHALADNDRAICALERKMLESVLGQALRLSHCRLDGHRHCDFEPKPEKLRADPSALPSHEHDVGDDDDDDGVDRATNQDNGNPSSPILVQVRNGPPTTPAAHVRENDC